MIEVVPEDVVDEDGVGVGVTEFELALQIKFA